MCSTDSVLGGELNRQVSSTITTALPGWLALPAVALLTGLIALWLSSRPGWLIYIGVIILAVGVATITLPNPFFGVQLAIFTLPVMIPVIGETLGGTAFFNVHLSQILALLAFVAVLGRCITRASIVPPMRLAAPFAAIVLCYFLSFINSTYPADSVRAMVKILGGQAVLFFVIVVTATDRQKLERVFKLLAWGVIITAWIGFYQAFGFYHYGQNWTISPVYVAPTALFTEWGWYGIYPSLTLGLFIPFGFGMAKKLRSQVYRVAAAHCVAAILLSKNRASSLSALTVVALAAAFMPAVGRQRMLGNRIRMLVVTTAGVFLVAGAVIAFFPDLSEAYVQKWTGTSLDDPRKEERVLRTQLEIEAIRDHPFIGNGVGTWGNIVWVQLSKELRVSSWVVEQRGGGSFNIFLGFLYDAGVLGFLSLMWLLGKYFFLLRKGIRSAPDDWTRMALFGCLLAFSALLINCQANPLYLTDSAYAIVALGVAVYNVAKAQHRSAG